MKKKMEMKRGKRKEGEKEDAIVGVKKKIERERRQKREGEKKRWKGREGKGKG
jgi:hypothetical protein